jgi:hypothetical protein
MKFLIALIVLLTASFCFGQGVKIKPKGGIYMEAVYVKMTSKDSGAIYFTTDGSLPNLSSAVYHDSLLLSNVTVLRAVTYIDGRRSEVNTQSFFIGRDYTLPVISIVSDPHNFWSYEKGIYVKGCCADSTMPYYNANFWKSWEYPCNVELYSVKGKQCINQQAGMSLFGGYSRMLPQKSLAIIARSKYGKKRFKYRIFKERKIKKYKSFIIRNSGGDFKRTQLRDAFMTQLAKPTGVAIQAYEPAVVYINGQYWGIQNIREKISEHYLAANYKVDKDKLDILRHNAVKRHGYSKNYKFLISFLRNNDLSDDKIVDSLATFMDIHDYIRYNIAEVYSDNKDAGGNIRYFRERKPGAKWRWIFYDLDMGLSNDDKNGYASNTLKTFTTASNEVWPNPAWSTFIIRTLLQNKKIEEQYITTFCDYLNTCFHADTALALLNKMAKRIEDEIPFHQKRWGTTVASWHKNIDIVREFVEKRPAHLYRQLDQKFGLDTLIEVSIKMPDENVCDISLNSIKIDRDFKGKYFTYIPQNIIVKPKHDYKLVGWSGRNETSNRIDFSPISDEYFEPIIVPKDSSSHKGMIILNELNISQTKNDTTGDWIELFNNSAEEIDLSGWVITDDSYNKGFKIDQGTIRANSYALVANNVGLIRSKYDLQDDEIIGELSFGLSKKGEELKLYDANGLLVDYLVYDTSYSHIDTNFSLALSIPDSSHLKMQQWLVQKPSPLEPNPSHIAAVKAFKETQAKEAKMKAILVGVVGGLFGVIVIVFITLRRKKKINR